jgi:hypothetical protein
LNISSGDNEDEYGEMKRGKPEKTLRKSLLTHTLLSRPKSNPRRGDEKPVSNSLSYGAGNNGTGIPEAGS